MPNLAPLAVLLAVLCASAAAPDLQAAVSPAHPASTVTDDRSGSPWGYERQRQKAMRHVSHIQTSEQEPLGKGIRE